jgi:hypothetical protein
MLSSPISVQAAVVGVTVPDMGGVAAAHEYMHMVIEPSRDRVTWDQREHLIGNPGGNSLMGDAAVVASRQEATVVVNQVTQRLVDFARNPSLR